MSWFTSLTSTCTLLTLKLVEKSTNRALLETSSIEKFVRKNTTHTLSICIWNYTGTWLTCEISWCHGTIRALVHTFTFPQEETWWTWSAIFQTTTRVTAQRTRLTDKSDSVGESSQRTFINTSSIVKIFLLITDKTCLILALFTCRVDRAWGLVWAEPSFWVRFMSICTNWTRCESGTFGTWGMAFPANLSITVKSFRTRGHTHGLIQDKGRGTLEALINRIAPTCSTGVKTRQASSPTSRVPLRTGIDTDTFQERRRISAECAVKCWHTWYTVRTARFTCFCWEIGEWAQRTHWYTLAA